MQNLTIYDKIRFLTKKKWSPILWNFTFYNKNYWWCDPEWSRGWCCCSIVSIFPCKPGNSYLLQLLFCQKVNNQISVFKGLPAFVWVCRANSRRKKWKSINTLFSYASHLAQSPFPSYRNELHDLHVFSSTMTWEEEFRACRLWKLWVNPSVLYSRSHLLELQSSPLRTCHHGCSRHHTE